MAVAEAPRGRCYSCAHRNRPIFGTDCNTCLGVAGHPNWQPAPAASAAPVSPAADKDPATHPAHYTRWAIEPITFAMRNGMEFWRGNCVKYITRAGHKLYPEKDAVQSEITDLRKAIRCAEMRINLLNGETTL